MGAARATTWRNGALAIAVAALLTLAWSWSDRAALSTLILPDPDDMMRLAQIRDWIGGQAFSDLTQHRLGSGLPMHWSRLPDLVPAALILIFEPLAGRHAAELVAVIVWPALLFAATLALLVSVARRLAGASGAGVIALLLGALAYPMTGFFTPGRIDHHGFQLVLLLIAARALLGPPLARAGAAIGLAVAASLAIGLESAPLCAIVLAALALRWASEGASRGTMLAATGATLAIGTALAAWLLAPQVWPATRCDAFTPPIAWLAIAAGGLLAGIGLLAPRLTSRIARLAALAVAGILLVAATPWLAPACLAGPYGAVPPVLRALWLDHVAEAQPLLSTSVAIVIGYAGLMFAGLLAALWRIAKGERDMALLSWTALLAGTAVLSCVQLRLAPFGAALAVPMLAAMIARARSSARPLVIVAAWLVSAGILYPLAARAWPDSSLVEPPRAPCLTTANLRQIAALGPGMVAVPLDMGAYVLASGSQRVLAAPYHRNTAANLAHYRLFLGAPAIAAAEARRWQLKAIAYCPDWLADLDPGDIAAPGSIVRLAKRGQSPDWTHVRVRKNDLVILKVKP